MCESSGNWSINNGNGFYGGLQFTQSTWDAFKPAGAPARADQASVEDQVAAAEATLEVQGIGAWPVCGAHLIYDGVTPGSESNAEPVSAPSATKETNCGWEWPVDAPMSQGFNGGHDGIDLAGSMGQVIVAATSGTISVAGFDNDPGGYGNYIQQEADSGESIQYGHVSEIYVSAGDYVQAGDAIGAIGNAGSSTGPHLHFRIHNSMGAVDPAAYLNSNGACDTGSAAVPDEPAPEPAPAPVDDDVLNSNEPGDPEEPLSTVPNEPVAGDSHTVVEGDTLSDIAAVNGITWQDLLGIGSNAENFPNPDLIFPGQTVEVA